MPKTDFRIEKISKHQAETILLKYHYLKNISNGFKSGYNYGLFKEDCLSGVVIFTGFPVPELVKGMLGLDRTEQQGLFELSRLCLEPNIQKEEHNLASWFVSKSIRQLKRDVEVKVILSYADSEFHEGTVYKACNFDYYGMTAIKKDFWIEQHDGTFKKHSRGKTKGVKGKWLPRSRKHRYLMVFDKKLTVLWEKVK